MTNGWTGGQHSVFRALLGAFLAVHFARLVPYGGELYGTFALPLAGAALSVALAIGFRGRLAALLVFGLSVAAGLANPLTVAPESGATGWVLLAMACVPAAPYGSWDARRRPDPGAGWARPGSIHRATWLVLALAHAGLGLQRPATVEGVLGLAFAVAALVRPLRPWAWLVLLPCLVVRFATDPLGDPGLVLLHAFAFDPAWIPAALPGARERVFYDGTCGLCHRAVRLVLAEDRGEAFRFAPLGGDAFLAELPEATRLALPDSLVVRTTEGEVLVRSDAIRRMLARLGGVWRILALALALVPKPLRDLGYDGVARVRKRIFAAPPEVCPIVPKPLRARFDA